jgi:hypothetical protein
VGQLLEQEGVGVGWLVCVVHPLRWFGDEPNRPPHVLHLRRLLRSRERTGEIRGAAHGRSGVADVP